MNKVFNVFLISEAKKGNLRGEPLQTFIEKDYQAAKLYFQAWISCSINKTPVLYNLHKIAEIDKNFTLKPCMIFIDDSVKNTARAEQGEKVSQLTLKAADKYIKDAYLFRTLLNDTCRIKAIFDGKLIKE